MFVCPDAANVDKKQTWHKKIITHYYTPPIFPQYSRADAYRTCAW